MAVSIFVSESTLDLEEDMSSLLTLLLELLIVDDKDLLFLLLDGIKKVSSRLDWQLVYNHSPLSLVQMRFYKSCFS